MGKTKGKGVIQETPDFNRLNVLMRNTPAVNLEQYERIKAKIRDWFTNPAYGKYFGEGLETRLTEMCLHLGANLHRAVLDVAFEPKILGPEKAIDVALNENALGEKRCLQVISRDREHCALALNLIQKKHFGKWTVGISAAWEAGWSGGKIALALMDNFKKDETAMLPADMRVLFCLCHGAPPMFSKEQASGFFAEIPWVEAEYERAAKAMEETGMVTLD